MDGGSIDSDLPDIIDDYLSDDRTHLSRIPKSIIDRYAPPQSDCLDSLQSSVCDDGFSAVWIYDVIDYDDLCYSAAQVQPNTFVYSHTFGGRIYRYINPKLSGFAPAATHVFVFS